MIFGLRFSLFRLFILTLAFLSQAYLYIHIRRAIQSSGASYRSKRRAIGAIGAIVGLFFTLNTYFLLRPVAWVDPPLAAQIGLFYPAAIWNLGSIFSALVLLVARLAGFVGRTIVLLCRRRGTQPAPNRVNLTRRRFLQAGAGGLAATPMVLCGYGAAYAGKTYEVQELDLPFGHPLRVVQLTDIHAGIYMTPDEMQRIADQVAALRPDLFVLTGDFISNSMVFLPGCLREMARVRSRFGTFACLGNHEYMSGSLSDLQAAFAEHRIPLLINAHRVIHTERGRFAVAGIDDLQRGSPDLGRALRDLDPDIPTLLLSHYPEIFPRAADRGIPLTLSGHYHGGQVKLILPGKAISFAHFRTPYPEGLFRTKDSHLYVSRGVGTTFTPVRLNASPEITLFRLT